MAEPILVLLSSAAFGQESRLPLASLSDRFAAAVVAERAARLLAFPRAVVQAARLIACELAENAVVHGGGGTFRVAVSTDRALLGVVAEDRGAPFRDLTRACCDGSTDLGPIPPEQVFGRRGIGSGLGAVRRFASALIVEQGPSWKRVMAVIDAVPRRGDASCRLELRTSTEPAPPGGPG